MGIGGNFWDLLKPYARTEGFDFLRNKRVAVDLSYWIVQHETAIKGYTRNPHLRLTFFRTVNIFSKFGAYPVFVVDGAPSPLKSQSRIMRFFRASGIDFSSLPVPEEGATVERNRAFVKYVAECVELLGLLGMPVLKAKGEAEALCAQLNREGHVDACITADSDAFLYGAKCVIKRIQPNSKGPFECYHLSDIETGLGLKRKHLIAVSLLVGNDHDINGIPGIGIETALRFVKSFTEDDILNRLREIGRGDSPTVQGNKNLIAENSPISDGNLRKPKISHCSHCGHPGSKRAHLKFSCEHCSSIAGESCMHKPLGFKCDCMSCDLDRKEKEEKKSENWRINVCRKIALELNFPNDELMAMYLSNDHGTDDSQPISWTNPKTDMLIDYLAYQQNWEPSYIRQRLLPMLSTIYLRNMASSLTNDLLSGQYEFDSIQRVKVRFGHQFYVVNWKKAGQPDVCTRQEEPDIPLELREPKESRDLLEDPDVPLIHIDDGHWSLSTDEDMELVRSAFPDKVNLFLQEKELKEMKSRKKKSSIQTQRTPENSESPVSRSKQLSITEFYRSSKVLGKNKCGENAGGSPGSRSHPSPKGKKREQRTTFSKSARRRLSLG